MDRNKVVEILTSHDGLRPPRFVDGKLVDERADFAAYLNGVFAAAEKVAQLEKRVAELESAAK